jgi:hypothetical protein
VFGFAERGGSGERAEKKSGSEEAHVPPRPSFGQVQSSSPISDAKYCTGTVQYPGREPIAPYTRVQTRVYRERE